MTRPARVVVDPNVWVSAAIAPAGTCGRLVDLVDDDTLIAVSCPQLISELRRALLRPKLRRYISADGAHAYCDAVQVRTEVHPDPDDPPAVTCDRNDDYLAALARKAGVDAIISGDRGLQEAELPVSVWAPRTALDRLTTD